MIPPVNLAEEKKDFRADRLEEFLRIGHILHKELESITGRLSYSQTSVFRRFGRGTMHPLYRKMHAAYYQSELSDADRAAPHWRAALIMEAEPRRVISRNHIPDKIIYTDAVTEAAIFPIVVFDKRECGAAGFISDAYQAVASGDWIDLFSETNLIYGLELLAAVQTAADPRIDLDRKKVTFYIENNNAKMELIKSDSKRPIIAILVRIFCAIMSRRSITPPGLNVPHRIIILLIDLPG